MSDTHYHYRLAIPIGPETLKIIDRLAAEHKMSRTETCERLLRWAALRQKDRSSG